jgi:hypothetical protein
MKKKKLISVHPELTLYLNKFIAGNEVESVIMGGIADSYERGIQDLFIQTIRQLQYRTIIEVNFSATVGECIDKAVALLNKFHGFSGAQVGAAKNISSIFWKQTPEKALDMMRKDEPDRIIKIKMDEKGFVQLCKPIKS